VVSGLYLCGRRKGSDPGDAFLRFSLWAPNISITMCFFRSGRLFATPSFTQGFSRILDLGGTVNEFEFNVSLTPEEADRAALWSDWCAVGDDMSYALALYDRDRESIVHSVK